MCLDTTADRVSIMQELGVALGGDGSGVSVHNQLSERNAANAHPIDAITGLGDALANIDANVEALSNSDIDNIFNTAKGV